MSGTRFSLSMMWFNVFIGKHERTERGKSFNHLFHPVYPKAFSTCRPRAGIGGMFHTPLSVAQSSWTLLCGLDLEHLSARTSHVSGGRWPRWWLAGQRGSGQSALCPSAATIKSFSSVASAVAEGKSPCTAKTRAGSYCTEYVCEARSLWSWLLLQPCGMGYYYLHGLKEDLEALWGNELPGDPTNCGASWLHAIVSPRACIGQ